MRLVRFFLSKGFDRSLALTELFQWTRLHSLSLGVRHLRGPQPSYWWVDAVFAASGKGVGLPTMRVLPNTPFTEAGEVDSVCAWIGGTTAARGLHPPNFDEQLWCRGADEANFEAGLEANLADAFRTLPGKLVGMHGYLSEDERTGSRAMMLWAEFSARRARALLHNGSDAGELVAVAKDWSARQGVPVRWEV